MPARFRELLADLYPARRASQLVIVPWFDGCLRVFPIEVWEKQQQVFDARFGEMDLFGIDEDESDFRRFVYGSALDVQLDANGRLLMSQDLREHAEIDKEIYWVGLGPILEIWSPGLLRERMTRSQVAGMRRQMERRLSGTVPEEDA